MNNLKVYLSRVKAVEPKVHAFLDFNEGANFDFISDVAAIKVHKSVDPDASA